MGSLLSEGRSNCSTSFLVPERVSKPQQTPLSFYIWKSSNTCRNCLNHSSVFFCFNFRREISSIQGCLQWSTVSVAVAKFHTMDGSSESEVTLVSSPLLFNSFCQGRVGSEHYPIQQLSKWTLTLLYSEKLHFSTTYPSRTYAPVGFLLQIVCAVRTK